MTKSHVDGDPNRMTDSFMEKVSASGWDECLKAARSLSGHYSMTEFEQLELFKIASTLPMGSTIVEIGVCNGKTAAVLSYVAKERGLKYFGVDNFCLENKPHVVIQSLQGLGYDPYFLVGDSAKVQWGGGQIDFLIIDGGHDEKSVRLDCEKWVPIVRSGGYVAWHDYDEVYDPKSAHHAIREHADRITKDWEIIETAPEVYSLFIAKKP